MKKLPALAMVLISVVNGCDSQPSQRSNSRAQFEIWIETKSENTNSVNRTGFEVRVADTEELRRQGLSGIRELAANEGMLFVVGRPTYTRMWMKGCYIPLDVLYFDADKKLINYHMMAVPAEGTADYKLPVYPSDKPAKYAVELAEGTAEQLGVKPAITTISFPKALLKRLGEGTE